MYAEAVLRGGQGGTETLALKYVNDLRDRAYGNQSGRISLADLKATDFLLNERSRELYWEGTRRTDLVRFGRFTTASYLWPWKGGVAAGKAVSTNLNLYPLPSTDIVANPTLVQNPGY
ncbi:MAG: RagB/SusD family nutrient uptake outer membrane protein, partial [Cytophagaceae bacterium]